MAVQSNELANLNQEAQKSIFTAPNKVELNPQQAGRFLKTASHSQMILKECNVFSMRSPTKNLDRIDLNRRVLTSGYSAQGITRALDANEKVQIKNYQNQLVATKLKAQAIIQDDELTDNIQRKAFTNTLIDLTGERIGYDLEVWAVWANRPSITFAQDRLLNSTGGFIAKSGNTIYGKPSTATPSTPRDFDPNDPISLFDALLKKTPNRFITNRSKMRFYVPYDIYDRYLNHLNLRMTQLGDQALTGYPRINYKGIPIMNPDSLDDASAIALWKTRCAMLANPENLNMGIWKHIFIEPDRNPQLEQVEFVFTMRADVHYTNEFAGAVALLDRPHP